MLEEPGSKGSHPKKANVGMERVCSDDTRQQIPPFDFDLCLLKPACPFGFKISQALASGLLKSDPTHLPSIFSFHNPVPCCRAGAQGARGPQGPGPGLLKTDMPSDSLSGNILLLKVPEAFFHTALSRVSIFLLLGFTPR